MIKRSSSLFLSLSLIFSSLPANETPDSPETFHHLWPEASIVLEFSPWELIQDTGLAEMFGRYSIQDLLFQEEMDREVFQLIDQLANGNSILIGIDLAGRHSFLLEVDFLAEDPTNFAVVFSLADRTAWETFFNEFFVPTVVGDAENLLPLENLPHGRSGFKYVSEDESERPDFIEWGNHFLRFSTHRFESPHALDVQWYQSLKGLQESTAPVQFFYNPISPNLDSELEDMEILNVIMSSSPLAKLLIQGQPMAGSFFIQDERMVVNTFADLSKTSEEARELLASIYSATIPEGIPAGDNVPLIGFGQAMNMEMIQTIIEEIFPVFREADLFDLGMEDPLPVVNISTREVLSLFRGDISIGLRSFDLTDSIEPQPTRVEAFLQLGIANEGLARGLLSVYAGFFNMIDFGRLEYTIQDGLLNLLYVWKDDNLTGSSIEGRSWTPEMRAMVEQSQTFFFMDILALHPVIERLGWNPAIESNFRVWLDLVLTIDRIASRAFMKDENHAYSHFYLQGLPATGNPLANLIQTIEKAMDPALRDPELTSSIRQTRADFEADPNQFVQQLSGFWLIQGSDLDWGNPEDGDIPWAYLEQRDSNGTYISFYLEIDENNQLERIPEERGTWNTNGFVIRYFPEEVFAAEEDDDEEEPYGLYQWVKGLLEVNANQVVSYWVEDLGFTRELTEANQVRVSDDDESIMTLILQFEASLD